MDQDLEKVIRDAYAVLPNDVKKVITSLPVLKIMEEVSVKNGLHIDQAGDLYTETIIVLLGIDKISNFVANIQKAIGVPASVAENIVNDVNQKIFLTIRESLQNLHKEESRLDGNVSDNPLDRDQILSEIENPEPTVHPISVVDQTIAGPAQSREVISETKESVAHDFIQSKLTQTVNLPAQNAVVSLKTPETKAKSYAADPYREAIN